MALSKKKGRAHRSCPRFESFYPKDPNRFQSNWANDKKIQTAAKLIGTSGSSKHEWGYELQLRSWS
jgi:hypothetical protein